MNQDLLMSALAVGIAISTSVFFLAVVVQQYGQRVRLLAWIAFILHLIAGSTIWYVFPHFVASDAVTFDRQARAIVEHHVDPASMAMPGLSDGKEGFVLTLAFLYRLTAPEALIGVTINALFCALLVLAIARTTNSFNPRSVEASAVMATTAPPFLWWGSQLLRDPMAWLAIAIAGGFITAIARERFRPTRYAGLLAALAVLATVRAPVAVIVGVGMAIALLLASDRRPFVKFILSAGILVGLALLSLYYAGVAGLTNTNIESVVRSRNSLATNASTGFTQSTTASASDLSSASIDAIIPVTFGPLPWQLAGQAWPAVFDTVTWWAILALSLVGWLALRGQRRLTNVLTIPAVGIIIVLIITSGNFGTMIRIRAQAAVLLLPIAAVGWTQLKERRLRSSEEASKSTSPSA